MAMALARIQQRMAELDGWAIEGATDLVKEFSFANFPDAVTFVNEVAILSEQHRHHPTILIAYTTIRLTLTTHSERGLTEKDFELAKVIDNIKK